MTTPNLLEVLDTAQKSRRGGHHNKGRKFPIEPMRDEEFARLLAVCVPQGIGRRYEIGAARLRALYVVLFRSLASAPGSRCCLAQSGSSSVTPASALAYAPAETRTARDTASRSAYGEKPMTYSQSNTRSVTAPP